MWWILNSSLLAGARRDVPILVLVVCGCLFLFYTPLPTLVRDLQHPELSNWHTRVNPLPVPCPGPGEGCPGTKKYCKAGSNHSLPVFGLFSLYNSASKDDSFSPSWSIAFLRDRERQRQRVGWGEREPCFQYLAQSRALSCSGSSQSLGSSCL